MADPSDSKQETVLVATDLPLELHAKLKARAEAEDRSMAAVLRRLIAAYVESPAA